MKKKVQAELLFSGGPVAKRLLANSMNVNILRPYIGKDGRFYVTDIANGKPIAVPVNNATLRRDQWKEIDTEVLRSAQYRLVGVGDLYSRNLVKRLGNGLAKTVMEYEDLSELTAATMSMDAVVHGEKDRPEYQTKYLPLPITHKEFSFNSRVLAAGGDIDSTTAGLAGRVVAEYVENMLFRGSSSFAYGGGTIYGYLDYPYVNTVTMSTDWADSAATGEVILSDVMSMKQASLDARHYGPFMLYHSPEYETKLDEDFKSNSDKTIRQRIMEVEKIEGIKAIDTMPAGKAILVQMTSDVVRMVEGLPLQTVEWEAHGGFSTEYKVLTIMVPQIRSDQSGRCGVTVLSA